MNAEQDARRQHHLDGSVRKPGRGLADNRNRNENILPRDSRRMIRGAGRSITPAQKPPPTIKTVRRKALPAAKCAHRQTAPRLIPQLTPPKPRPITANFHAPHHNLLLKHSMTPILTAEEKISKMSFTGRLLIFNIANPESLQ